MNKPTDADSILAITETMHLYLGRMVDEYGQTESGLNAMVKTYMLEAMGSDCRSDKMDSILRLVVSGLRMSTLKDILRQFVAVQPYNEKQRLWISNGLNQISEIGFIRQNCSQRSSFSTN